jgi:threonine dehydrogenase-like Zn-dependent dehydrogenase
VQTIYMDTHIPRLLATKTLGQVWSGSYVSRVSPVRFADQSDPPLPQPHGVRVGNDVSLICGSDLHLLLVETDPRIALASLPSLRRVYLGHEVCGHVLETGAAVTKVRPGDRVALQYPLPSCLTQNIDPPCPACADGRFYLCQNQAKGLGPTSVGGGWGDQMIVHERQLYRAPDYLADDQVALLEPAAVALHAVLEALPQPGQTVLVVGAGVIGLLVACVVRALVPEARLTLVARYPFQADAARRLGIEDVQVHQNVYQLTVQRTGAQLFRGALGNSMLLGGFDSVFDCVGSSRTLTQSLRYVRARGTVVAVGIQYRRYTVDLSPLYYQEVRLLGTWGYGVETWEGEKMDAFELASRLVGAGRISLAGLITHRFPLAGWRQAVTVAAEKKRYRSIKVGFDLTRKE